MVLINRDLLEPAPDQGFVKFRQVGRLAANEILKRCDALDLFVSCYRVNGGLLFQCSGRAEIDTAGREK